MVDRKLNIALLLPSPIIEEGITVILRRCDRPLNIYSIEKITDLDDPVIPSPTDLVIIDPMCIVNRLKEWTIIRKNHTETKWIGVMTNIFDSLITKRFEYLINMSDTPETIVSLIMNLGKPGSMTQNDTASEFLSDRETEVLRLLVTGHTHKEIADKLFISIHTVISHRKNITMKTGIKSQSGLTIYALTNRIINL